MAHVLPIRRLMRKHRARILALILVLAVASGVVAAVRASNALPFTPDQPINYSHALHAGKFRIDCLYCHFGAERGKHAGVPPASVCMNCHQVVKVDSAEVHKIKAAVESNTPIRWNKVHRFPDHTSFDHSRHVAVAKIKCQECHGPVETMERILPNANLAMGDCLRCHRGARGADRPSTDCTACHH